MRTKKSARSLEAVGAETNVDKCHLNTPLVPGCQDPSSWFARFFKKGEATEIRALGLTGKGPWEGWAKGTVSGYFNDPDKFAKVANALDSLKRATGIYFTLNPVDPALLARANNRLIVPKAATSDEQIVCHRWFLIDTDPERPSGISATDSELKKAITCRNEIADFLSANDFPEPMKAHSGNGGHLLYRLTDLSDTLEIAELKRQALKALNYKFGGNGVEVDQKVFNASRITKLYGTWARKGDSTDDRPHRRSYLEAIPDPITPVTLEQLEWLASLAQKDEAGHTQSQSGNGRKLNVEAYLSHYGVEISKIKSDGSRTIYGLRYCVFDRSHTSNESAVIQMSDGKLLYQCFHSSCQGRTWAEARERISSKDSLAQFCNGYGIHQGEGSKTVQRKTEKALTDQVETPDDPLNFEIKEKPHLDLTQFSGLLKAFVELATRNSEADPAAVLLTFLARFSVEVGRKPFFNIGDTVHHGRLAVVIVGESAKARKGTSAKPVSRLLSHKSLLSPIEYNFARTSPGPFSSGEGIIYAVRDPIEGWNKKTQRTEIIDQGVDDKRLFVLDEEFGGVLANTKREGNTLSMVIRSAWDNGHFDPLTKNNKISAKDAHVGWVSHITQYELLSKLPECEGFNGFANRILWVFSRRQKLVPFPEPMPTKELVGLQCLLLSILNKCHECKQAITFTEQAKEKWEDKYYQQLTSQNGNGLLGVILNRAEAQVRRLALLFTLLDGKDKTGLKHLNEAMAAWKYCKDSAVYIFKGQQKDHVARKITEELQKKGQLTGTEIRDLFSGHVKKDRIERAIEELVTFGTAELVSESTGGRPLKVLKIKHLGDKSDKSDKRVENGVGEGLMSHRDSEKKPDEQEFEDLGAGCSDTDEDVLPDIVDNPPGNPEWQESLNPLIEDDPGREVFEL
jgi:hypothetical protein